jgi:hypothetical protein
MNHTHPMLRAVLKSQYHASLAMLREALERCPPEEWLSTNHKNAFWQVSYHALFFAHLYLQHDEAAFSLWEQHRGEGDGIAGEPYTQALVHEREGARRRCVSGECRNHVKGGLQLCCKMRKLLSGFMCL